MELEEIEAMDWSKQIKKINKKLDEMSAKGIKNLSGDELIEATDLVIMKVHMMNERRKDISNHRMEEYIWNLL